MSAPVKERAQVRVLVADDVADVRQLIRLALELHGGFSVIGEAPDGAQAVLMAGEHQPDVVVLDLSMPVMDGLQAIPEIQEVSPETKIVVLSAFDEQDNVTEAFRLGAHAFLPKGNLSPETISRLREVMQGSLPPEPIEVADLRVEARAQAAVIEEYAEIMLRLFDSITPEDLQQYLQSIARNSRKLRSILDEI